ncbi:MAG: YkgJ family cysteine cluster protein [Candidatus Thermoplasmatota archaeon]|nr:YkgJ family cysteine cluster protein [Candidatus Thermoplasmatota archaeon]
MKIIPKLEVIRRLNRIYAQIPSFECKHCQQCSNPIMWFKPEEINIKDYLKKHNLPYIVWTDEEFIDHHMKCPYLQDNKCIIYPVRPLVCRLQGIIFDLPCPYTKKTLLTEQQFRNIMKKVTDLNQDINGMNEHYGTRKKVNSNFFHVQKN